MRLFSNIWNPKKLVVVFVSLEKEETNYFAGVYSLKKDAIDGMSTFDSVDEIVDYFGVGKTYHIQVVGKGVLSRKVPHNPNYQQDLIVNGDLNDFLFSETIVEDTVAVSFSRKDVVEKVAHAFQDKKVQLWSYGVGTSFLFQSTSINCSFFGFRHVRTSQGIVTFERDKEAIGSTTFTGGVLDSLSLFLAKELSKGKEEIDSKDDLSTKKNIIEFKRFKILGVASVFTIFFTLVVNYFYMNHLQDDIANLEDELFVFDANLSLLDRLQGEKERKENLVFTSGAQSSNFLAYYLNAIGESVPEKIYLLELNVFPVDGKLKNKKKIAIQSKRITISGTTDNNVLLDDWIEKLDRMNWIADVEVISYLREEESYATFELTIDLAE